MFEKRKYCTCLEGVVPGPVGRMNLGGICPRIHVRKDHVSSGADGDGRRRVLVL